MSRRSLSIACMSLMALSLAGGAAAPESPAVARSPAAPASPPTSDVVAFARSMGLGWNLGNTLEATGSKDAKTVRDFETLWGAPVTTREMFAAARAAGFRSVRVPVAWSNLMGPDYTVSPDLLARVEQVVGYALDEGLVPVVNIHWDGGWWKRFPTQREECMRRYTAIWRQVAERFKDHPERLVLESLNEELDFPTLWNRYDPNAPAEGKAKAFALANEINQAFTTLVRNSGGNNARRYLLIAGYCTDIALTTDPLFKMPHDPAGRSMVSVHYYSPPGFAILDKDADWGKALRTWGTPQDLAALRADFDKLRAFTDRGIPVVVGEFGCATGNKDPESVVRYNAAVAETAYDLGHVPMLWDTGGYLDRRTGHFKDPRLAAELARIAAKPRP